MHGDGPLIKICGITRPQDAEAAISTGADLLGFVFRPGTPRALVASEVTWVGELKGIETVGVFLDQPLDEVIAVRAALGLDWVQLHGHEPDHFLETLGRRVIRRVTADDEIDWARVADLAERSLPLFDPGAGDGVAWAWESLATRPPGLKIGLAGGLRPDNVADAVRATNPYLVDVSTGVESGPGVKDHSKISRFINNAKNANR